MGNANTITIAVELDNRISAGITSINSEIAKLGTVSAPGLSSTFREASSAADALIGKLGELAAGYLSVKTIMAGIHGADELRDLGASIDALSGSAGAGAEAMEFFAKASENTRATSVELASFYRDDLPLAIRDGFKTDQLQKFLVELQQIQPLTHETADELNQDFLRILSGAQNVGRSGLLKALGFTQDQIEPGVNALKLIVEKVEALAPAGAAMGQSFESTMGHVRDAIAVDFAEGFNQARGSAEKGMQGILAAVNDPQFGNAMREIGAVTAQVFGNIGKGIASIAAPFHFIVSTIEESLGLIINAIGQGFEKAFQFAADAAKKLHMYGVAGNAQGLASASSQFAGVGTGLMEAGDQNWLKFESELVRAFSDSATASDRATQSYHAGSVGLQDHRRNALALQERLAALTSTADQLAVRIATAFQPKSISPFVNQLTELRARLEQTESDIADKLAEAGKYFGPDSGISKFLSALADSARFAEGAQEVAAFDQAGREADKTFSDLSGQFTNLNSQVYAFTHQGGSDLESQLADIARQGSDLTTKLITLARAFSDQADVQDAAGNFGMAAALRQSANYLDDMVPLIAKGTVNAQAFKTAVATWSPEIEKAAREIDSFKGLLSGVFSDVLKPGSFKSFGDELSKIFEGVANHFGESLSQNILDALGVGQKPTLGGQKPGGGVYTQADVTHYDATAKGINQALAVGQAGYGIYSVATTPGMSVGQGALTGAALGAPFAGATYGLSVVIGAVIGAVAGALAPSGHEDYKYGNLWWAGSNGALITDPKNLSAGETANLENQLASTVHSMEDAYVSIFAKLGPSFLADMAAMMDHQFTSFATDYIGGAASQSWMKHIQEWLATGLPGQINAAFWQPLSEGLASIGLSAAGIQQIHDTMDSMDPKAALQYVASLVDGIQSLNESFAELAKPVLLPGSFSEIGGTLWDEALGLTNQNFAQSMAGQVDQIAELSKEIPLLTGQDQADAIAQMASLVADVRQKEIQFLQQIQAAQQQVHDTFEASIQSLTLAGFTKNGKTDYSGQEQYLYGHLQDLERQAANATNPADVTRLSQQIDQTIMQMVGIAQGSGNAQMAEQYRQWGLEELAREESALEDHLKTLADPIVELNATMLDLVAAIRQYLGIGGDTGTARGRSVPTPPPPPAGTRVVGGRTGDGGNPGDNGGQDRFSAPPPTTTDVRLFIEGPGATEFYDRISAARSYSR